jgi:hypothetical protein
MLGRWREVAVLLSAAAGILLPCAGCILGPAGDEPGYPTVHALTIMADTSGVPTACDLRDGLAAGAAGGTVYILDCPAEEILFAVTVADTVVDLALGDSWAVALLPDSIVPVSLETGQASEGTSLPAGGIAIAAEAGRMIVLCDDGSIVTVQEGSWGSPSVVRSGVAGCSAMAAEPGGSALFVADPAGSRIARVDVATGRVTAQAEVYGEVTDLEASGEGFCMTIAGSNEIWVMGPLCSTLYLLTFPEEPDCGAAMPDDSYFFAGCSAEGLVVCAGSGEQVHTDASIQEIGDISLSADHALIACSADSSLVLLER